MSGWTHPLDPRAPDDMGRCECCGWDESECCCPPCKVCGEVADPKCYQEHDMELTAEQESGLWSAQQEVKDADDYAFGYRE